MEYPYGHYSIPQRDRAFRHNRELRATKLESLVLPWLDGQRGLSGSGRTVVDSSVGSIVLAFLLVFYA